MTFDPTCLARPARPARIVTSRPEARLVGAGLTLTLASLLSWGCAKVQTSSDSPVGGGSGGSTASVGLPGTIQPSIPGLKSIAVSPALQTVMLTQTGATVSPGNATFTASGTMADGSIMDVTNRVSWLLMPSNGMVNAGDSTPPAISKILPVTHDAASDAR